MDEDIINIYLTSFASVEDLLRYFLEVSCRILQSKRHCIEFIQSEWSPKCG